MFDGQKRNLLAKDARGDVAKGLGGSGASQDDGLAEALLGLSQEDREIFMMHWFLRMTDAQIARYINMPRRTVNTRRHKAYRLLTELMGGEADD